MDDATAAEPRVLSGRYELHARLGTGGAGAVWAGHDRALDRPVAVKLLHADLAEDPAAEARFRTEATAAAKLTHPNAVLVYDVGRDGDDDYLVMELVTGASLASLLADGPLAPGQAAAVGTMVASALGVAHRVGVVHRDVKPGNVMVTVDGQAKLADFGIARALGDLSARLTRTGTVLGTARYLAPEQLRDDPIDARADVYSLGVVLHEALTGAAPFGEGTAVEVATRRLTAPLPAVTELAPDVPPDLAELVDWATRLDPRERPADGTELAEALRTCVTRDADLGLAERVRVRRRPGAGVAGTPTPTPALVDEPARDDAAPAGTVDATRVVASAAAAGGAAVAGATRSASPATAALPAVEADPGTTTGPSDPRRPWLVPAVVTALIAVIVLAITAGGDGDGGGGGGGGDDAVALEIVDAGDHDPFGNDLEERPEDIPAATDGDLETFWPTQTYNSADLGGLKPGVGMWVQLDGVQDVEAVDVTLTEAAGQLELWVGDGPPDRDVGPEDWGELVGSGSIDRTAVRFPLADRDLDGDTLLLWFTELPPGGGGFRAEVREVAVLGR